jgi:hypothetical protein
MSEIVDYSEEEMADDIVDSSDDEVQEEESNENENGRGVAVIWKPILCDITGRPMIFDDKNRADQFARDRDQYKIDGRILWCTYHVACQCRRNVKQVGNVYQIFKSNDLHTTEILVCSTGIPKVIRNLVDDNLLMKMPPLQIADKLHQFFLSDEKYRHHLTAYNEVVGKNNENMKKFRIMMTSRGQQLRKSGECDALNCRKLLADYLIQFQV